MNNEKPTKAQEKAWLSRVAEYVCVATGQSNIQLHHCVGREGKHNKYHIGRWFVLPLAFELHDVSKGDNPLNITHHRKEFVKTYGTECYLFSDLCMEMGVDTLPFDADVFNAILRSGR